MQIGGKVGIVVAIIIVIVIIVLAVVFSSDKTPVVATQTTQTTQTIVDHVKCSDGTFAPDANSCVTKNCNTGGITDFTRKIKEGEKCPEKTYMQRAPEAYDDIMWYDPEVVASGLVKQPPMPHISPTDPDRLVYDDMSCALSIGRKMCPDGVTSVLDLANCPMVDCNQVTNSNDFLKPFPNGTSCPEKTTRYPGDIPDDAIMWYSQDLVDAQMVKPVPYQICPDGKTTSSKDLCPTVDCNEITNSGDFLKPFPNGTSCPGKTTSYSGDITSDFINWYPADLIAAGYVNQVPYQICADGKKVSDLAKCPVVDCNQVTNSGDFLRPFPNGTSCPGKTTSYHGDIPDDAIMWYSQDLIDAQMVKPVPYQICPDGKKVSDLTKCPTVDCNEITNSGDFLRPFPNGTSCPGKTTSYHGDIPDDAIMWYSQDLITSGYVNDVPYHVCADGKKISDTAKCPTVDCNQINNTTDFLKPFPNGSTCPSKSAQYSTNVPGDTIMWYPQEYVTTGYVNMPNYQTCPDGSFVYDIAKCPSVDCNQVTNSGDFLKPFPNGSSCPSKSATYTGSAPGDSIQWYPQQFIDNGYVSAPVQTLCDDNKTRVYNQANCPAVCPTTLTLSGHNFDVVSSTNKVFPSMFNTDCQIYCNTGIPSWRPIQLAKNVASCPPVDYCWDGTVLADNFPRGCPSCEPFLGKIIKLRYSISCSTETPPKCDATDVPRYLRPYVCTAGSVISNPITAIMEPSEITAAPGDNQQVTSTWMITPVGTDSVTGLPLVTIKSIGGNTDGMYLMVAPNNFQLKTGAYVQTTLALESYNPATPDKYKFYLYSQVTDAFSYRCVVAFAPYGKANELVKQDDYFFDGFATKLKTPIPQFIASTVAMDPPFNLNVFRDPSTYLGFISFIPEVVQ